MRLEDNLKYDILGGYALSHSYTAVGGSQKDGLTSA